MNRRYRITSTNDFQRVRHSGRSYAHPLVLIIVAESVSEGSHIGIITSKSIGNAVQRNKARRRLRSWFSAHLINFLHPRDIVVIARKPITGADYPDIDDALCGLMRKAGILGQ